MLIIHISVRVKPEMVEEFKKVTIANAQSSLEEPGIARFEVLQQTHDPARFLLAEAYRSEEAIAAHKETAHYAAWRDAVEPMMAEERTRIRYTNVYPEAW